MEQDIAEWLMCWANGRDHVNGIPYRKTYPEPLDYFKLLIDEYGNRPDGDRFIDMYKITKYYIEELEEEKKLNNEIIKKRAEYRDDYKHEEHEEECPICQITKPRGGKHEEHEEHEEK